MKPFSILSFFIVILFTSCEKDVDLKIPVAEPKLVISSLIYPQNPITQVALSLTNPIYNSTHNDYYEPLQGATVVISDGSNSWTLPYDTGLQTYAIDSTHLKIKINTLYKLSVSTADGRYAEASTTVPAQNRSLTYSVNPDQYGDYILHGSWNDPANSADFYRLEISRPNSIFASGWSYLDKANLNDEGNPGGTLGSNLYFYSNAPGNDSTYVSLLTASSEFYNYFNRRDKIQDTGGPFNEPIPMYTNISGGLGVFAGFNPYRVKVVF